MEPPSPIQALGVNPFLLMSIAGSRIAPRGQNTEPRSEVRRVDKVITHLY